MAIRVAPIGLHQITQVGDVLPPQGLIESGILQDPGAFFRRQQSCLFTCDQHQRVAGHEAQEEIQRHGDQDHEGILQQTADQNGKHCGRLIFCLTGDGT
ncbi:MAG: hypothetical protein R2856_35940 [Caldilineaceae bacterium]